MERFLSIPLCEQETTVSFRRDDEEVEIWTNDRTMINKLDKLCKLSPLMYRCTHTGKTRDGETMDRQYVIASKSMLSFLSKKRTPIPLTEEQKEQRREQLRRIREKQNGH